MPGLMGYLSISHERQKSLALIVAVLVILRSHIPTSLPKSLQHYGRGKRLTEEELAQVRQELYRQNGDGSITLLVPFRGHVSKVSDASHYVSIAVIFTRTIGTHRADEGRNSAKGRKDVPPSPITRI